jgi:hypothetical protein
MPVAYKTIFKIGKHDIVTHNFLRYTFPDVISSRFKASFPHTADAAISAHQS